MNPAFTYSTPCRAVNKIANTSVIAIPNKVAARLPSINAWWAYVTVAPDDSRRIVFNNGMANGLSASIPLGVLLSFNFYIISIIFIID